MTRATVVLLGCACLVPATADMRTSSQALPTVDQILEKNIEASGGRAALEKITSVTARGTISVPDAGVDGTIQLYQKAPDKALTIVDLGGVQQREGFDGTVGWSDDPQNGVREKSGVELSEAKRGAAFSRELKMKELYKTITVKGREKAGTSEAYVLELVPAEGTPSQYYYDVNTGLIVRQVVTRQTVQGPIQVDVTLEDYRVVDGVKRPFRIRQATAMFTALVQLSDITHNAAVDDAVFRKPK